MTRFSKLTLYTLIFVQLACAVQPVTVSAPSREYSRSTSTAAFVRHNQDAKVVYIRDSIRTAGRNPAEATWTFGKPR